MSVAVDHPSAELAKLVADMEGQRLKPLWEIYTNLVLREPRAAEPSAIWRWAEMLPLAERAAQAVQGELADHRVMLLNNPGLAGGPPRTTTRLIAGMQCVMPGERTIEHRHTAAACRLVLECGGAVTYVDGRPCEMVDNDFIITPNWTWHGHANDTGRRAIWLDLLDVPFTGQLNAIFGRQGPANGDYPAYLNELPAQALATAGLAPAKALPDTGYSLRFRYPWAEAAPALAACAPDADGARRLRYADPLTGGPIMATMDATLVQVPPHGATRPSRTTATGIIVVLAGSGHSNVGEVRHLWSRRDVFTLPHWQFTEHRAGAEGATLLVVSDAESLRRLRLLREEAN